MAVLSSPKSNKASESEEDHPSASPSTLVSHGTQEEEDDDDDDDDDDEEEDDEEEDQPEDRSQQTPTGTKKEDKTEKDNSHKTPENLYGEKATADDVYVEPWKGGPWSQDEVCVSLH
jgi:hypothetical protein